MSGITETLTGNVTIDARHKMTAYDDTLNIIDATITLIVPGDLSRWHEIGKLETDWDIIL